MPWRVNRTRKTPSGVQYLWAEGWTNKASDNETYQWAEMSGRQ